MNMVGVGSRPELVDWINSWPPQIDCLEIIAEHLLAGDVGGFVFTEESHEQVRRLSTHYPLVVHVLASSLATPGPMGENHLEAIKQVVSAADPLWVSDHIAFSRTSEIDLGHYAPIKPCQETIEIVAEHAHRLASYVGKPVILENVASHLRISGPLSETDFLNRLSEAAGCGLLLDVTSLLTNSYNHGFDPLEWVRDIDPYRIVQLHVTGFTSFDQLDEDKRRTLWSLTEEILAYAPVQAIIVERAYNFPPVGEIEEELERLKALTATALTENKGEAALAAFKASLSEDRS